MINLVVFDMAGTTVVDKDYVAHAFQKAFWNQQIKVEDKEINPLMGYHKPTAIKMVLEKHGRERSKELIEKIHHDFTEEMLHFYTLSPYVQPMPDAEDVFFFFKEHGVKIALNTGFYRLIADAIVHRFQWMEWRLIDDLIASDEVPKGRPFPYMIETLMQRNRVADKQKVMKVGDTVVDVLEGRSAGCGYNIAVTTGATPRKELEEVAPTHIIDHLSQIPSLLRQPHLKHA